MKREGKEGWNGVPFVTFFFHGRTTAAAKEKEKDFLDDFLITRLQSRVSARRKRHFARTLGRQLARETERKAGAEMPVGTIQDLCYLRRTRGTHGVHVSGKSDWWKRAGETWRSFRPIYIRGGRNLFRGALRNSHLAILVILPSRESRITACAHIGAW